MSKLKEGFTIKEIKRTNLEDTFFGTYFYRKLATYFSYFLVKTPLTPNHISFLSLLASLAGALFFTRSDYPSLLTAAFLIQVGMVLDYSDGQIARLKGLATKRGAWLDVILGMIQNNIIVLAIILGLYIKTTNIASWIIGFFVLFAWNMTCFVHLVAMIFLPKLEIKKTALGKDIKKGFRIQPQYLSIGSDVYFVVFSVSAILNSLSKGLLLMAILGNLYWLVAGSYIFLTTKHVKQI